MGILRIDRLDGRPLAVACNFACHPLIGVPNGTVTANYAGFASRVIEENLDGVTALFLQGTGGDIVEAPCKDVNRPREAEPLGTMLGMSTLKALKDIRTKDAKISVASETIGLPRRTDVPERIVELQEEQADLLKSLRFTSLNFKAFLPLYIRYALNPGHPSDYSHRYLQAEKIGDDSLRAMDAENRSNIEKYLHKIRAMERLARIQDKIETLKNHKANKRRGGRADDIRRGAGHQDRRLRPDNVSGGTARRDRPEHQRGITL